MIRFSTLRDLWTWKFKIILNAVNAFIIRVTRNNTWWLYIILYTLDLCCNKCSKCSSSAPIHIFAHFTTKHITRRGVSWSLMGVATWTLRQISRHMFLPCFRRQNTACLTCYVSELGGMRSGDRDGQFCRSTLPIRWPGKYCLDNMPRVDLYVGVYRGFLTSDGISLTLESYWVYSLSLDRFAGLA